MGTGFVIAVMAAGVALGAALAYLGCAAWAAQSIARAEARAARLALATAVMQGRIVCSAADGRHVFLVTEMRRD